MASIVYDEATKKWRGQVYVGGKRSSKSFRLKSEAKEWADAEEQRLKGPARKDTTLAQLLERYKRDETPKKATKDNEALRIDAFLRNWPKLAANKHADLTAGDLAAWRDARLAGRAEDGGDTVVVTRRKKKVLTKLKPLKSASVLRDVAWLKAAVLKARGEWGLMPKTANPFEDFETPKNSILRDRVWSWREIRLFVRSTGYRLGTHPRNKTEELGLALLIACRTGMRSKEILQIGKSAFLAGGSVLRVSHKMQYKDGKPRDIPLFPSARRLFKPFLEVEKLFSIDARSRDALTRDVIKRLMLENLHFHDTRGTALTHMSRRVDVLTLARISGHKDINLLYNRYYRERAEAIANRLR